MANPNIVATNNKVLECVQEQIRDLQPALVKQVEMAEIIANLEWMFTSLDGLPPDASLSSLLHTPAGAGKTGVIEQVNDIQSGNAPLSNLGNALVGLYIFQQLLDERIQAWLSGNLIIPSDADKLTDLLLKVITRIRQLLNYRPDVGAILDDLSAIKNLKGGPADATAFHDFHVLQVAFRDVWMHAFDDNLKLAAESLYEQTTKLYDEAGITVPPFDAIEDVNQLNEMVNSVRNILNPSAKSRNSGNPFSFNVGDLVTGNLTPGIPKPNLDPSTTICPPPSIAVTQYFGDALPVWVLFSDEQRAIITSNAAAIDYHKKNESPAVFANDDFVKICKDEVTAIIKNPRGNASRLARLILEIGKALNEPYAFDVFAPDSYNYGLMVTYRQKWEPGPYQAGDLAATIPLAPGEVRKYSKKVVKKTSVATKNLEKSMESRSQQSSTTSRAENDIFEKVTRSTSFKQTAHASFNIGIGQFSTTVEVGANSGFESARTIKNFHEETLKAAQEYKLEHSLEIDSTTSIDTDESYSSEISNPNNEITVTYLFYELQRRFKIHEFLYRVRPVILVAQDVPSPHEIDEAWLIQYQWIIRRVLLDDSLRPALEYLNTGFAGDEVSVAIIRSNWESQRDLVKSLEGLVTSQLDMRNKLREAMVETTLTKDLVPKMPDALKFFTFGGDPTENVTDALDAQRKAAETRLQYTEQALADAQEKLKQATTSFEKSTEKYSSALQNQYTRHNAIDQLRIHIKQNILYYMQAIWAHEFEDQRFFRLYNKKVICPEPQANCASTVVENDRVNFRKATQFVNGTPAVSVTFKDVCVPTFAAGGAGVGGHEHELIEVADLDNLLGYKGNYLIFPLKDDCYLTTYMLTDFINNYFGVWDPGSENFDEETFDGEWNLANKNLQDAIKSKNAEKQAIYQQQIDQLKTELTDYVTEARRRVDEIIVPTGQLFIEALPGTHPLLEDFKLEHRFLDVRKVKAEVRHAEMENLRLATRLATGQDSHTELLEDPDIEKKVTIEGKLI